jgi:hypothetical protein
MENKNDESRKLLLTLLVGGVVGAGVVYYVHNAQNRPVPFMKKIGKTISEIGDALGGCNLNSAQDVMKNIQEKAPSALDVVSNVTDWVDTGLTLWKKFKKG